MATITATKEPQFVELAYGKNIVSLFNSDYLTDPPGQKYLIQIVDADTNAVISDIRQTPNPIGYGHFDLSRILQNQVSGNPALETINRLSPATTEVFNYNLAIGYVNSDDIPVTQSVISGSGVVEEYDVMPGRKLYTQVDWPYESYVPSIAFSNFAGVDVIQSVARRQKALTDRHIDTVTGAQITDGKPTSLGAAEVVHRITLGSDDYYTLSFLSRWDVSAGEAFSNFYNGIGAFGIYLFNDADTEIVNFDLLNITSNGGGPDTSTGQNLTPSGSYTVISCQTSKNNPLISLQPDTTYFYVNVKGYSNENYGALTEISEWYRFDIDDGECNDFNHIQVSWLNSFGFRDYYTFEKRNDYQINVDRNTFQQLDSDWTGADITVNSYNRGETVYNQLASEEYTANTKYLSDVESQYLKNLYLSPDVKVRFNGSDDWVPVVLTSNQWTERTYRKDKLFQHTITFKPANPINMQQG